MDIIEMLEEAQELLIHAMHEIEDEKGYSVSNPMIKKLDTLCGKLDNYIVNYREKLND